ISTFRQKSPTKRTKARRARITAILAVGLAGGAPSPLTNSSADGRRPRHNSKQARRPVASQARWLGSVRLALPSTPFEFRRSSNLGTIIYTLHAAIRGFLPAIGRFPKDSSDSREYDQRNCYQSESNPLRVH